MNGTVLYCVALQLFFIVCHIFIARFLAGIYSLLFVRIFFYIYAYKTNTAHTHTLTYSEIREFMRVMHWILFVQSQAKAVI